MFTLRKSLIFAAVASLALGTSACSGGDDSAKPGEDTNMKIGFTSAIGPGNVAIIAAAEELSKKDGVGKVDTVAFSSTDLAVQGLASGDVQLMAGNGTEVFIAIAKGAPIRAVGQRIADEFVMAGGPKVKTCEDADGKRMGIHSEGGITTALAKAWFLEKCPDVKPQYVAIEGSDNRVQALLADQLDLAIIDVGGVVQLQKTAPDKIGMVDYLSEVFPEIQTSLNWIYTPFVKDHPEIVSGLLEEQVKIQRKINDDPTYLVKLLEKYLPDMDADTAELTAKAYVEAKIFPTDGGVTADRVGATIDWLVDNDLGLKKGDLPDVNGVYDSTYLDTALENVGTGSK